MFTLTGIHYEMALYMDSQNRDWEEFQQHLDEQTNLLDILDS